MRVAETFTELGHDLKKNWFKKLFKLAGLKNALLHAFPLNFPDFQNLKIKDFECSRVFSTKSQFFSIYCRKRTLV